MRVRYIIAAALSCSILAILSTRGQANQLFPALTMPSDPSADPDQTLLVPVAGGNVPVADIGDLNADRTTGPPRADQGNGSEIILAASSIGALTTSIEGYGAGGQSARDLSQRAEELISSASPYKELSDPNVEVGVGPNAWKIYFPGVIDPTTEQPWVESPDKPQNYFAVHLEEAERHYRAAIHAHPLQPSNYAGLLRTYHERMVPLVYAGNEAMALAAGLRFNGSASNEIAVLEEYAYTNFRSAAGIFMSMTGAKEWPLIGLIDKSLYGVIDGDGNVVDDPVNRGDAIREPLEKLFATYARAISRQIDARLRALRLEYFASYSDPNDASFDPQFVDQLVAEVDNELLPDFSNQVLLGSSFARILSRSYESDGPVLSEFGLARSGIERIRLLRNSMASRELSFVGATNAIGTDQLDPDQIEETFYEVYGANYVPFLFSQSGADTVEAIAETARSFALRSSQRDAEAKRSLDEQIGELAALDRSLEDVSRSYVAELSRVCGVISRDDGQPGTTPALAYCLFPPEAYEALEEKPPGSTVPSSEIYLQWGNIEQAEKELEGARLALTNLYDEMKVAQETAAAITGRINETASIIKKNGEKLAALDIQLGEIQAQLAISLAAIQKQASKRSFFAANAIPAVKAVGALYLGQTTIAAQEGGKVLSAYGAYRAGAIASGRAGAAQAEAARKSARIQAQKARINAMQSARMQYDQAFINDIKSKEAMHSMMLRAEQLKLGILLAEQRLSQENNKLDALYARVGLLLEQYRNALVSIVDANPLAQPDYRLLRNLTLADAESAFIGAQEQAFLVSRAAKYKVNHSGRTQDIRSLEQSILGARTGAQLENALANIEASVQQWYLSVGAPGTRRKTMSLRHYLLQNNAIAYTAGNGGEEVIDVANSTFEPRGSVDNSATPQQLKDASDAEWQEFLQRAFNGQILRISFSTGLSEDNNGDPSSTRVNELFEPTGYNMLITGGSGSGVGINIRGRGITGISSSSPVQFQLDQKGASYIRAAAALIPDVSNPGFFIPNLDPSALRVWNVLPISGTLNGSGTASINGSGGQPAAQFFERSPANDRWELTFFRSGAGNTSLLNQLEKIQDIEITFDTELFFQSN